ncbi:hypothetical protein C6P43_003044 [Kluyveromyces marxianus]|nr:hypothetical protein C6P43_003044 [Kluyveromyces marxianus]
MAFEPIDTTTYSREIEAEYLKVVTGDEDTTWLIISPNAKKQYEPELVGTSFTEFLHSFDDTKVQYGLARVSPPGSDVQKLILIGWCPDSAPLKTRASFAQNFGVISNQVLKTYHVQVTARDEDDLDESELLMKISNSAGARYSIQQQSSSGAKKPSSASSFSKPTAKKPVSSFERKPVEKASSPAPAPAPTPARRTVSPKPSAGSTNEDGWDEPELEERDFHQKPLKPNSSSWKPIGKVDLQKVIAEEKGKEDPRLVVSAATYDKKIDPQSEIAKLKEESKLKRDADYDKVLGVKAPSPAATAVSDNSDRVIKGFKNEKSPSQLWAEKKRQKSSLPAKTEAPKSTTSERFEDSEKEEEEQEDVENIRSKFESMKTEEVPIIKPRQTPARSIPEPPKEEEPTWAKKEQKFGQPLPGLHDQKKADSDGWSDDEEEEEEEGESRIPVLPSRRNEEEPAPALPVRRNEPESEEEDEEPAPVLPSRRKEEEEDNFDEPEEPKARSPVPPPAPRRTQPAKPAAPSAIAEYDYEAAEDNELTFQENDKIINIQFVDDDWWLGELESSGEKGLFPSNYVSLEQ